MTKIVKLFMATFLLGLFIIPISVSAAELKSSENLYIPQGETIDGNLYTASNNIIVDGDINGDLIALAKTITINGRLDGDLIALAQTIVVNGEINGNLRSISNTATINGSIARNVNFVGNNLNIEKNAQINWDLVTGALNTDIKGTIKGNVDGSSDSISLAGKIGKNFNFSHSSQAQKITISPEANINGDFLYSEGSYLNISEQANITGKTESIKKENTDKKDTTRKVWSFIYKIFAVLVIGLVLSTLGKKHLINLSKSLKENINKSLTWGLLTSLIVPLVAIILTFSIIGMPLALILVIFWITLLCLGKIIIAILVGKYLLDKFSKNKQNFTLALIVGVIILWSLCVIPYLGWLISFVASSFGLGAILIYFKKINSYV
ncbi:MAG: polymer-forming cytoskeletal protein [Patescibacteria group bacterium]|nr:polymer-forming cytoskeletal protein [Patescibacteria group bacterium]